MNKPLRILLVENHDDTREVLEMLLAIEGHTVEPTDSCASARASFSPGAFDILLSDIGLPDGDGWSLFQELRRLQPKLAGIAMSGFAALQDHAQSAKAGFAHHLTKPVEMEELRRLLEQSCAPRANAEQQR